VVEGLPKKGEFKILSRSVRERAPFWGGEGSETGGGISSFHRDAIILTQRRWEDNGRFHIVNDSRDSAYSTAWHRKLYFTLFEAVATRFGNLRPGLARP